MQKHLTYFFDCLKILAIENFCTWNETSSRSRIYLFYFIFMGNWIDIFSHWIWSQTPQLICLYLLFFLLFEQDLKFFIALFVSLWTIKSVEGLVADASTFRNKKKRNIRTISKEMQKNTTIIIKNGNHFLNARLENYLLVSDPTYVLMKQKK